MSARFPQRFKNSTRAVLPGFGIFRLVDGTRLDNNELVPYANTPNADGEEPLYVNSPLDTGEDEYGWCRSIHDPPFWVLHGDDAPTAGDIVGPVEGETHVSDEGSGLVVIYVDDDKGVSLCDLAPASDGSGGGDTDFPDNRDCDCGDCEGGEVIPGALECCRSHLTWRLSYEFIDIGEIDLHYAPNDKWISDPFPLTGAPLEEGNSNEYRWQLTIDVDGRSYLDLVLETDNGGDPICVRYGCDGFQCQCPNAMSLEKPWGRWSGIDRSLLSCKVCLRPVSLGEGYAVSYGSFCINGTGIDRVPYAAERYAVTIAGCVAPYESVNGTYALDEFHRYISSSLTLLADVGSAEAMCAGSGEPTCVNLRILTGDCTARWRTWLFSGDPCVLLRPMDLAPCVGPFEPPTPCQPASVRFVPLVASDAMPDDCVDDTLVPPLHTSGACEDEDCGTTPEAPVNPTGCCCYANDLFDYWDSELCGSFGGQWHDDCSTADCNPAGVCCFQGVCFEADQFECEGFRDGADEGVFIIGGDCDTAGICDSTGACCHTDGTCSLETEEDCNAAGDTWYGVGETCDGRECLGSCCCYVGGSPDCCLDTSVTEAECDALPLGDCDAGAGTAVWYPGDLACADCGGTC